MKNSRLCKIIMLAISIVPLLSLNSPSEAQTKRNIYSCINHQGKPSTVVDTEKGRILLIVWESDFFISSGWTPQKRCEKVSLRFQKFSDNKQLRYLITGKMNGQHIICVGKITVRDTQCIENGLLITLEGNNDNPNKVLEDLFPDTIGALRHSHLKYSQFNNFLDNAPVIQINPTSQMSSPQIIPIPPKENPDCPPIFCD